VFVAGYFAYASASTEVRDEGLSGSRALHLRQNYPNPFNGSTMITFELPNDGWVRFRIFDIRGREVDAQDLGWLRSGLHTFQWNASTSTDLALSSGVYILELMANDRLAVGKLILAK